MTDLEQFSRQVKPFIDENLQFQMPLSKKINNQMNTGVNPIFCHYVGTPIPSHEINTIELYDAIKEAESSYVGWQERKNDIIRLSKK